MTDKVTSPIRMGDIEVVRDKISPELFALLMDLSAVDNPLAEFHKGTIRRARRMLKAQADEIERLRAAVSAARGCFYDIDRSGLHAVARDIATEGMQHCDAGLGNIGGANG